MDAATTLPAGAAELTLGLLNVATHAWVEQEYHRAKHFDPLTDVTQGAPKLALATYPSRLRLDVKASFDAPAIGPCVTSALKLIYNAPTCWMHGQA
ncbi:MAG: hypothetical protein WCI11_11020 [Candidatus Methylumidiphilus sp.]